MQAQPKGFYYNHRSGQNEPDPFHREPNWFWTILFIIGTLYTIYQCI